MTETTTTTDEEERRPPARETRPYWQRYTDGGGGWVRYGGPAGPPPGEELAALRQGAGRMPGSVPAMWRFLVWDDTEGRGDGSVTPQLVAEHHALVLYAIHQQSQGRPVHRSNLAGRGAVAGAGRGAGGVEGDDEGHGADEGSDDDFEEQSRFGVGDAVRRLHIAYRSEAVDGRFYAAVMADSVETLAVHLRGLVTQMRALGRPAVLDYDQLYKDLVAWQYPDRRDRVRRAWGRQYYTHLDRDVDEKQSSST